MEKIRIESSGISPWHYQLENMSWWGAGGKDAAADPLRRFRVDGGLKNGGRGLEDVLMADFLNSLDFLPTDFLNKLLHCAGLSRELVEPEIRGNAGNYYIHTKILRESALRSRMVGLLIKTILSCWKPKDTAKAPLSTPGSWRKNT